MVSQIISFCYWGHLLTMEKEKGEGVGQTQKCYLRAESIQGRRQKLSTHMEYG